MPRASDPKRLFVRGRHPVCRDRPFPDELAALTSRKKPMAFYLCDLVRLVERDFMRDLQRFARGDLVVTLSQPARYRKLPPERQDCMMLVTPVEQLWRVPAFLELDKIRELCASSEFVEDHRSALLGYTRPQRRRWHAYQRHEAHPVLFLYMLLDRAQKADALAHGKRCLGDAGDGVLMAHARRVLRRDAIDLVPSGMTLARFDVDAKTRFALFPDWATNPGLMTRTLKAKELAKLNAGLVQPIRFLTRAGWR